MLEALGVAEGDEKIYRTLLRTPHRTLQDLSRTAGLGVTALRRAISRLEALGLVSRLPGRPVRLVATRPDIAIDVLATRRERQIATARAAGAALLAELPPAGRHSPDEQLEIVFGREAVATRFLQLQQAAREEMVVLDRPPYAQDPHEPNPGEDDLLTRGVRLRAIYAPEAFEVPGALDLIEASVAAGEEARTTPDVPLKLAIADRSAAILPFTDEPGESADSALVVYASTLLSALVRLFDLLWASAVPVLPAISGDMIAGSDTAAEHASEQRLVSLLAAGLKDEAVARQLGVSLRTVHRRTSDLMARLGARTRFQAGVQAAREELVP